MCSKSLLPILRGSIILLLVLSAFCDVLSESSVNSAKVRVTEPVTEPTDSGE